MATQLPGERAASAHSLPEWFLKYQDNAGLSILLVALMGINAVVYGSGVVPDITRPSEWGLFRTILFVLFALAGTVMPGLALRFGVGVFTGHAVRRMLCVILTLVYFGVEVWASITERSLTTITTPADRWLMQLIGAPQLPFSPTVLAISLSLSIAVVGWGIVVTPPQVEDLATAQQKETLATLKARGRAERAGINAVGMAKAAYAARQELTGRSGVVEEPAKVPTPLKPVERPVRPVSSVQDDPEDEDEDEDEPPSANGTIGDKLPEIRIDRKAGQRASAQREARSFRYQRVVPADVLSRVIQVRTPVLRSATA